MTQIASEWSVLKVTENITQTELTLRWLNDRDEGDSDEYISIYNEEGKVTEPFYSNISVPKQVTWDSEGGSLRVLFEVTYLIDFTAKINDISKKLVAKVDGSYERIIAIKDDHDERVRHLISREDINEAIYKATADNWDQFKEVTEAS